ncbi:uncharacterized protein LOC133192833 [Saccostrea echinata]|uniref:uncharacterized protein LOC133192833 n=1 Tax=Saccostrea echinata TaxID=191078 RepID=UPI002A7F1E8C|nr:uncharacterized protein LOC133192833 [Saccostrea echinata]
MSKVQVVLVIETILCKIVSYGATLHEGDWELVFHAVSGSGENVTEAWRTKYKKECDLFKNNCPCSIKDGCLPSSFKMETLGSCPRKHLRSVKIDYWNCLDVKKVKLALNSQGKTLAFLEFDGKGSNLMNWFQNSRILNSSWTDMNKHGSYNVFSIDKENRYGRHFFVNKVYPRTGCAADEGWLVVMDFKRSGPCPCEAQKSYPQFLYSPNGTVTRWQKFDTGQLANTRQYTWLIQNGK